MPDRRRICHGFVTAASLLLLSTPGFAQSPQLRLPDQPVLAGTPIAWGVDGLRPGQTVRVQAERAVPLFTGSSALFRAEARFQADAAGRVDFATQAPLPDSSYRAADARGLLWSMRRSSGDAQGRAAGDVALKLLPAEGDTPLAQGRLQLRQALPTVQTRVVPAFPGALLAAPAGARSGPTLILLGGSEGGSFITRDAAHWASFGYTVLALPYYSPPGWGPNGPVAPELPQLPANFFNIPVERLQAARDWLATQPEVDAKRIGLMGTSKGAEFALLAAVRMPWIRAVAAIVPSDVVWEGWGQAPGAPATGPSFAWQGEPLAFVPYKDFAAEFAGMAQGQPAEIRRPHDKGRAAASPEQIERARIPVERIAVPVLVAGADDDRVWPSGPMAAAVAERRQAAGLPTVLLRFPEAGHFLGGTGTAPTTHYNEGPMKNGGRPEATAAAQAATHAALLQFFASALSSASR